MARLAGFEPANAGTKTQCLTTWRQPNVLAIILQIPKNAISHTKSLVFILKVCYNKDIWLKNENQHENALQEAPKKRPQ